MKHRHLLVAAGIGIGICAVSIHAANPWFGLTTPQGLSDPHQPVVDVARARVSAATVPPGEEGFTELRGERIKRDVAAVVDFSKQSFKEGNRVWGRVTGFPSAKATIDWSAQQFKAAGLQRVEVQEYAAAPDTAMWWATDWEVKVLGETSFGDGSKDVVLQSSVPTSGSSISGPSLTGPLVFVGAVTDSTLPDVDVKERLPFST
jgi:hypothetical protein